MYIYKGLNFKLVFTVPGWHPAFLTQYSMFVVASLTTMVLG